MLGRFATGSGMEKIVVLNCFPFGKTMVSQNTSNFENVCLPGHDVRCMDVKSGLNHVAQTN